MMRQSVNFFLRSSSNNFVIKHSNLWKMKSENPFQFSQFDYIMFFEDQLFFTFATFDLMPFARWNKSLSARRRALSV